MYYGLKTSHCKICTQPYQIIRGCIFIGIDCLCGDCITKLRNGEAISLDDVKQNYEQRIEEIESNLPPEIGPERQAMKRQIIEMKRALSYHLSKKSFVGGLLEHMEELKGEDLKLEDMLAERSVSVTRFSS